VKSDEVKIQKLTVRELDDVFDISLEQFGSNSWTLPQFESCINDKNYISYILKFSDNIVSFLIAQKLPDSVNLLLIATKSQYKNKGFATMLVKKLFSVCDEKIWLEVRKDNPAVEFYEKLGFKLLYERKNYYKDVSSALVLEKYT
jgi:ribosomal-protein-alanine N-acetyltransferase